MFASSVSLVLFSVQLADVVVWTSWSSWTDIPDIEISVVFWMFLLVLSGLVPVSWYSFMTLVVFVVMVISVRLMMLWSEVLMVLFILSSSTELEEPLSSGVGLRGGVPSDISSSTDITVVIVIVIVCEVVVETSSSGVVRKSVWVSWRAQSVRTWANQTVRDTVLVFILTCSGESLKHRHEWEKYTHTHAPLWCVLIKLNSFPFLFILR